MLVFVSIFQLSSPVKGKSSHVADPSLNLVPYDRMPCPPSGFLPPLLPSSAFKHLDAAEIAVRAVLLGMFSAALLVNMSKNSDLPQLERLVLRVLHSQVVPGDELLASTFRLFARDFDPVPTESAVQVSRLMVHCSKGIM